MGRLNESSHCFSAHWQAFQRYQPIGRSHNPKHFLPHAEVRASNGSMQEEADRRQAEQWSRNLGQLSEGQRSICALVFVMAAASAGVKPAILLVDEVDAALGVQPLCLSLHRRERANCC
jgi:hypothetical protein